MNCPTLLDAHLAVQQENINIQDSLTFSGQIMLTEH